MKRSPHGARRNLPGSSPRVNRSRKTQVRDLVSCGWHAARAVLEKRPDAVRRILLLTPPADDFARWIVHASAKPEIVDMATLDRASAGVAHQGIVVVSQPPPSPGLKRLLETRPQLLLALDGVTDPRNVGAIARSAEAAGFGGLILTRDRAPELAPALVKTAAGAVEYLPFVRVTNLVRALDTLGKAGYWRIGLAADAECEVLAEGAVPGVPAILVVGAEDKGLRPLVRDHLDRLLRIPMRGEIPCLNVSVAAGIGIFACSRALRA